MAYIPQTGALSGPGAVQRSEGSSSFDSSVHNVSWGFSTLWHNAFAESGIVVSAWESMYENILGSLQRG